MERRIIVGAGGFGREVRDLVRDCGAELVGFLDDRPPAADGPPLGAPYLGQVDAVAHGEVACVVAVGYPRPRRTVAERLAACGRAIAPPLVHPRAQVGSDVDLGEGCIVTADVNVTTAVRCGRFVTLHPGCLLGHDVVAEDFVAVMPGASISGNVRLGAEVLVGTNAAIIQGVSVGAGATIGAGAVVVEDVPAGATVVGVPARPLERRGR